MKLTKADLQRLQTATNRFVKLPDSGWAELDTEAVTEAHETMADLGVENLSSQSQNVSMFQAQFLGETAQDKAFQIQGNPLSPDPQKCERRLAPLPERRSQFPLPPDKLQAGRCSGRRHGIGKNPSNPCLAGLVKTEIQAQPQTYSHYLPRFRPSQLGKRSQSVRSGFQSSFAGKRFRKT